MPILDENSLEFISRSPEQTRRVGVRLGSMLYAGDVVCMQGELGTGKTTLVQGIAQGWGSNNIITSPTFILINNYTRPDGTEMYHLDAYRLKDASETEVLDLDAMVEDGVLLVEWPERIAPALPLEYLWIEITWIADEQRRLMFLPHGQHYLPFIPLLRQLLFSD